MFFNRPDRLVPGDINAQEDVYEWEPSGTGSCSSSSGTFSGSTEGCLALVSSGVAAGESGFLDASETGGDVFFLIGEPFAGGFG